MSASLVFEYFAEEHPYLGLVLVVSGVFKVCYWICTYAQVLIDTLAPRSPQLDDYKPSTDGPRNWAVVTGSTAGIGEEFASQLAQSGFNLVLVSRSEEKLALQAKELTAKFGIKTVIFVLDAANPTKSIFTSLKQFVNELEVSVLINNLGISHEMPVPFSEVSDAELSNIIQVNCTSTLEITRAVLPALQKHTKTSKKRGLVMTMGSFAGLTPTPLLSVYSGSKAFLQAWSSALAVELKPFNIDVQLVISYLVTSKMSKIRRTSLMVTDPKRFVAATLRQTNRRGGAFNRAFTVTPFWSHALMHYAIDTLFGVFSALVSAINYNMHVDIRRRALKRAQQKRE